MMVTLCPHCHTVARVQAALLNAGELQCGRCGQRYAPLGQLFDDALEAQAAALARTRAPQAAQPAQAPAAPPETAPAPGPAATVPAARPPLPEAGHEASAPVVAPRAEPEAPLPAPEAEAEPAPDAFIPLPEAAPVQPPRPVTGADWDAFGQPPLEGDVAASVASREELDLEVRRQIQQALLEEMAEPRRRVSGRTWLGLALVLVLLLVLVLAGQWLYHRPALWVDHPQWRPWADRVCAVLGCELPLRRDTRQIELLDREVRDHPRLRETVLITASFVNRAGFTQAYPVFEVIFSDLSGRDLAVHRFRPEQYLEDPAGIPVGLAPGEVTRVRLEVPDPGRQSMSFRMEFR